MEERSLRVYQDKTFFSKISNTITKLLIPTRVGINGVLISIKRNNAIKAFDTNIKSLTSQYNSFYAGKNILPEGGYIVYNYSLVAKSSTYKSASIRITNSGAMSN